MNQTGRHLAVGIGVLLAGVVGAGISLGALAVLGDLGQTTTITTEESQTSAALASTPVTGAKALTIPEIYERNAPGVVQVTSTSIVSAQSNPFFQLPAQKQVALGSGFVIDKQGHIVTNYHVIQGASSIDVLFSNNVSTKATVVGTDKSTDLAVLKVSVAPRALPPLSFGDSSALEVGDPVLAIGNPFGLDRSITSGIVSAIYNLGDGSSSSPLISPDGFPIAAIQTDAAINHGNSGGPLINSLGQVVGVNSQIETGGTSQGNVGIGFAVQSNTVKHVVAQIIRSGKATHAFLGVQVESISPELASLFRLPAKEGLLVERVTAGTGAAKAGIKGGTHTVTVSGASYRLGGDIIVAADGTKVGSSVGKLEDIIAGHEPSDKISLEVYRGDKKMTVSVTLGDRP